MDNPLSANAPTGLKGKIASLEEIIANQNKELGIQREEISSLRAAKHDIEEHYRAQMEDLKRGMIADVQKMQEEAKKHFVQQKAENGRVQQQVAILKSDKTTLQQQVLALQRRIQELEEQIGQD